MPPDFANVTAQGRRNPLWHRRPPCWF